MITTYLETRYVDRAKLNDLLQGLFGQEYSVESSGDTISVEAPRALTEVDPLSRNASCPGWINYATQPMSMASGYVWKDFEFKLPGLFVDATESRVGVVVANRDQNQWASSRVVRCFGRRKANNVHVILL
ncbi:hypothetical protein M406DRAFT_330872 [Cryphonectria parasitica EP155]|uniref:Uncharacterized protein n=1 Tax=Cryphonectria parasitica (strain ATCC 38755 / EP155) TaxID=660469 RepID=A0A9P5CMW3_CRYP1|nr:uncharacterized protein M406DRAFT_330872 [Cryphonectria parasitica EP155]KAF3764538.1 hypothetical protein M406DRAFT_330872 [Cryphonectria parasitica EP155]